MDNKMDNKIYDNFQKHPPDELKELIIAELIPFESLTTLDLEKLLAYETELLCHGGGDMEFLNRLASRLNSIGDYATESVKNSNDFASLVDEKINKITESANPKQIKDFQSIKKIHFPLKRIIVAVIAIAIVFSCGTLAPVSDNYGGWSTIRDLEVGEALELDGYTIYHAGPPRRYSTQEEMLTAEGWEDWDVLFPTVFPKGIYAEEITVNNTFGGSAGVSVRTNQNLMVSFSITKDCELRNGWEENKYLYEINGVEFYIYVVGARACASAYYNDDYYFISADTYFDLKLILKNLEKPNIE